MEMEKKMCFLHIKRKRIEFFSYLNPKTLCIRLRLCKKIQKIRTFANAYSVQSEESRHKK